jgi:hypothetical protein
MSKKYGNVYEIALSNGKYVYVRWIEQFSFGIFDYIAEKPVTDINDLLSVGFKTYKHVKRVKRQRLEKRYGN